MTNFNDFLNEQMKDPTFKAEWEALDPDFSGIEAILNGHRADGYQQVGARERKPFSAHAAKAGRRYGNARQNRVCAGKYKRGTVK